MSKGDLFDNLFILFLISTIMKKRLFSESSGLGTFLRNSTFFFRYATLSDSRRALFLLFFTFNFFTFNCFSQGVGISTTSITPDDKSILEIQSTNQGILLPRMNTTERDAIIGPIPNSLLIFNTTTNCFEAYYETGAVWVAFGCIGCVEPAAVAASAAPNPVCEGNSLTLTGGATDATSWSWTGPNGYTSSLQSPTIVGITTAGAGVYALTASNSCSSVIANTASVTVTTLPAATFSYIGTPYCSSATDPSPTFSGGGGGVAGTFTSTVGLVFVSTATGEVDLNASTEGTYTVTNTIVATGGCGIVTATSSITVTTLPIATFSYTGTPYCSSATNPLPTYSGGGVAGTYTSASGLVFVSTATGEVDLIASTTGTYTVTNTIAATGGCGIVTATSLITITPEPAAVTVATAGTYCNNTTLTASGGTGGTIYWQGTISNGTSTAIASTSQVVSATGTYYFRSYNVTCGWGTQGSAAVTINTAPAAISVSGGGTYCGSATLTVSGGSGGTIYWQGTTSNGTSTATASTSQVVSTSGTYYFRAYNSCGWGTQGSVAVTINPIPAMPGVISGPGIIFSTTGCLCDGTNVYSVTPVAGVDYTWSWTKDGVLESADVNNCGVTDSYDYTIENPCFPGSTVNVAYVIYVTATNSYGCVSIPQEKSVLRKPGTCLCQ